jgi:hypothetical protein
MKSASRKERAAMSPEENAGPHARIVRMANQIGTFFLSKPHQEGVAGVAEHINKFWEPRMRRQFFAALEEDEAFLPIVREAAAAVRRPD